MGSRNKVLVEGIGTYHLNYIDLYQTLYVPTFFHNLFFFLPKLNVTYFFCKFGTGSFSLYKNNNFVGSEILYYGYIS